VHFALAFAVSGAVAEGMGILAGRARLGRWGGAMLLAGTVSLVIAVASGYLAANTAPGVTAAAEAALAAHERFALLGAGALMLLVLWKALGGGRIAEGQRSLYAVALLAAAGLVAWAALLGGRLVYDHAVGVTVPD
jgi:uncharacterized membrane protein